MYGQTEKKLDKRAISRQRAKELGERIKDYVKAVEFIPVGLKAKQTNDKNARKISDVLEGNEKDWNDWEWQLRNRISDPDILDKILDLDERKRRNIRIVAKKYRFGISPYYASLINYPESKPLILQSIPDLREYMDESGVDDPMAEEFSSPAPCITRRYPDRVIINVTNKCAMFCRHCQRRRKIKNRDISCSREMIAKGLEYIRGHREIRDVLITGGDPLTEQDEFIEWILCELETIPHVEIKRIGTRTLVTLPMRITDKLVEILQKHLPLYINTQFNHPLEVTEEAAEACLKLAKGGIALGNQMVLLKGVNDNPYIVKKLNQELLKIMVRPYYMFHAKTVKGTSHFKTPIETGLEIIRHLRGYTSGLAIPQYVINAPGGLGKIPLLPNYIHDIGENEIILRTWEGKLVNYENAHKDWNDKESEKTIESYRYKIPKDKAT